MGPPIRHGTADYNDNVKLLAPLDPMRSARRRAIAVLIAFAGGGVVAAEPTAADRADARARYEPERAVCLSGLSHQPREICLREAAAALGEALKGRLDDPLAHLIDSRTRYEENALLRCDPLPPEDRELCRARMRGDGITRGSVEEGGIYRELTVIEVRPPARAP